MRISWRGTLFKSSKRMRSCFLSGTIAVVLGMATAGGLFGAVHTVAHFGDYSLITWPSSWTAIQSLNDGAIGSSHLDFVGDSTNPGVYFANDGTYLFFRVRVNYSGDVTAAQVAPFNNGTIFIFINMTNGSGDYPDYAFAWDMQSNDPSKHGLEMMMFNTSTTTGWNGFDMKDVDNQSGQKIAPPDFAYGATKTDGFIRTIDHQATTNFGDTVFIDFAVKCSYLTSLGTTYGPAINCTSTWYIQFGSMANKNDHNKIDYDVAGGKAPSDTITWPTGTAVELVAFTGAEAGGAVGLHWETASETDNAGFHVWRADGFDTGYSRLTTDLIPAMGTATQGAKYSFEDAAVAEGCTYFYKLEDVDTSGTSTFHGPVAVTLGKITPFAPPDGARAIVKIPLWFDWDGGPFGSFRLEFSASADFATSVFAIPATSGGTVTWLPATSYLPKAKEWEQIIDLARPTGKVYWRVRGITLNGAEAVSAVRQIRLF